jgi:hypothetical protein
MARYIGKINNGTYAIVKGSIAPLFHLNAWLAELSRCWLSLLHHQCQYRQPGMAATGYVCMITHDFSAAAGEGGYHERFSEWKTKETQDRRRGIDLLPGGFSGVGRHMLERPGAGWGDGGDVQPGEAGFGAARG